MSAGSRSVARRGAVLALAAASWAAAGAAERATLSFDGGPGGPVEISADLLVYVQAKDLVRLKGSVVVVRDDTTLRAAEAALDRPAGLLTLSGGVIATRGKQVAFADGAVIDLNARSAELGRAVFLLKERPDPALRELTDPVQARARGKNALTLGAAGVQQRPGGALLARGVHLTPCDCAGAPDYELLASEALLEDDRARLSGVKLALFGLGVPLFPLSLPLLERQSGLLQPQLGFASVTGFGLSQPIFLTLGRSWDLTLAPGLFTGKGDATGPALGARSLKGPRLGAELRWAPAEGSRGELALDLVQDLAAGDTPARAATALGPGSNEGRGFGGLRGALRASHRSDGEAGVFAAQLQLLSDAMMNQDAALGQLDRVGDGQLSEAGAWRARGPLTLGVAGSLVQDLRVTDGARPDRRLFGPERAHTPVRFPSAFAQLAPVLVGPAALSLDASATAFLLPGGAGTQERLTGFAPTDLGAPAPTSTGAEELGRAPVLRLDAAPRLSYALPAGPLRLRLQAGARADAWLFEGDGARDARRLQGFADLSAGLLLARRFDDLTHTVAPALQVRALTPALAGGAPLPGDPALGRDGLVEPDAAQQGVARGGALRDDLLAREPGVTTTAGVRARRRAFDELDGAAPSSGALQLAASLAQALWSPAAPGRLPGRGASLDLRQDVLLWPGAGLAPRLSEASAAASFSRGAFSAAGEVRWLWDPLLLTVALASARFGGPRGDLHGGLTLVRGPSGPRMRAGVDELFSSVRLAAADGELRGTAGAGFLWVLPVAKDIFRLGLDSTHFLGSLPADVANWTHRLVLSAETPCRCAGFTLAAEFPFDGLSPKSAPVLRFLLDLKSLGQIASQ